MSYATPSSNLGKPALQRQHHYHRERRWRCADIRTLQRRRQREDKAQRRRRRCRVCKSYDSPCSTYQQHLQSGVQHHHDERSWMSRRARGGCLHGYAEIAGHGHHRRHAAPTARSFQVRESPLRSASRSQELARQTGDAAGTGRYTESGARAPTKRRRWDKGWATRGVVGRQRLDSRA
jgi:hypothetical protein